MRKNVQFDRRQGIPRRRGQATRGKVVLAISALVLLGTLTGFIPVMAVGAAALTAVTATLITPDGAKTTVAHFVSDSSPYGPKTTRSMAIAVANTTQPATVQLFRTNPGGSVTKGNKATWDVAKTGYTYNAATDSSLKAGSYFSYAIVTFKDGSQSQSNEVTFVVMKTLPAPIVVPTPYDQ